MDHNIYSEKKLLLLLNTILFSSLCFFSLMAGKEVFRIKQETVKKYVQSPPVEETSPVQETEKFVVDSNVSWETVKGNIYPYSFLAPQTLQLMPIPDSPYDMYGISWHNSTPTSNIFIGVDNLENNKSYSRYISKPKAEYVENWWRQFYGLTGVDSLIQFTTTHGIKGYKVKYLRENGLSPYDDIFLEVPANPHLMIHLTNSMIEDSVFEKIVDSLEWNENK